MGFSLSGGPNVGVASGMLNASNNLAGQFGSSQQTEGAQLNPFFSQEMKAQHSLSPSATGEMLTAAEAGAGGAFGGAEGEMKANAARTGNATGITKSLDDMAREKFYDELANDTTVNYPTRQAAAMKAQELSLKRTIAKGPQPLKQ